MGSQSTAFRRSLHRELKQVINLDVDIMGTWKLSYVCARKLNIFLLDIYIFSHQNYMLSEAKLSFYACFNSQFNKVSYIKRLQARIVSKILSTYRNLIETILCAPYSDLFLCRIDSESSARILCN